MDYEVWLVDGPYKTVHTVCTTPEEAAKVAQQLNTNAKGMGASYRYRVLSKPGEDEAKAWRERETARFKEGTYTPVPWAEESWYARTGFHTVHFAHLSPKGGGLMAYTPDERHGHDDKQVPIKIGRYLNKYCGHLLTPDTIAAWCAKAGAADEDNVIKFAETGPEMESVYRNGPQSCLSHPASHWKIIPFHPIRTYADGDLCVAYLERVEEDTSGREFRHITARSVCWRKNKRYSRVYGDEYRFNALMNQMGFYQDVRGLEGARLKQHRIERNGHLLLVVPYVDWVKQAKMVGQEWIELGRGPIVTLQQNSGFVHVPHCRSCRNEVEGDKWGHAEDDNNYVICGNCAQACMCPRCKHTFIHAKNRVLRKVHSKEWMCVHCASKYLVRCIGCNYYTFKGEESEERTLCAGCFPAFAKTPGCKKWIRGNQVCQCDLCNPPTPEEELRRQYEIWKNQPFIQWEKGPPGLSNISPATTTWRFKTTTGF
jgi:hypothetical protein